MESQIASNADSICELNRYLRPRSGRNSWWFRRRVPAAIIKMVGQSEWRWGLKARNRDDAVIEAMPRFIETEAVIKQAERGDWPPMSNAEGMKLAKGP